MAVQTIPSSSALTQLYEGLSSDSKPTVGVVSYALFKEIDTGNVYEYSGSVWNIIVSVGAARVHIASDSRGDYPENTYRPIVINAAIIDLASFPSIQKFHSLYFEVWELNGETLTVTSLDEGGNTMGAIPVNHWDHATTPGEVILASAIGLGRYSFAGAMNVAGLVFTKSGSANAMKISGQMSGAS